MRPLYRPARVTSTVARFGSAFRGRDFRYLWLSDSVVSCSEQMEFLVLAWFILQETDSPLPARAVRRAEVHRNALLAPVRHSR